MTLSLSTKGKTNFFYLLSGRVDSVSDVFKIFQFDFLFNKIIDKSCQTTYNKCITIDIHIIQEVILMTTQVNVRIDETVKQQAEELLQGLGLSMSTAINLFARAIIREQGLPFELKYNNSNFTEQEVKKIDEGLLKSETDISTGRTIDARLYLQDKISKLEAMKNV